MQGWRILRVFTNVNPGVPPVWRVGEAFEKAAPGSCPKSGGRYLDRRSSLGCCGSSSNGALSTITSCSAFTIG
jgi:hypothetical protein